jgi:hypothetical protein
MRLRQSLCLLAALGLTSAFPVTAAASPAKLPFRASLSAPTHTPKIIVKWWYTVKVADLRGRPMRARITVRIKDPLGGVHQVQFGRNVKKDVKNYPIDGRFRDWVNWPRDSAIGVTLTFQVVVKTAKGQTVLSYDVRPHA